MSNIARVLFSLFVFTVGIALIYGGIQLVALGGSSYYLIAGLAYLVLTVLFCCASALALPSPLPSSWQLVPGPFMRSVQFSYWELLPRLVVPAIILTLSLWVGAALPDTSLNTRRVANRLGIAVFLALVATFIAAFYPHGGISNPVAATGAPQGRRALRHRSKLGVLWA